ncbi:hypothetical protein PV367_42780, partial [Streptomyces europaeiscabiei]
GGAVAVAGSVDLRRMGGAGAGARRVVPRSPQEIGPHRACRGHHSRRSDRHDSDRARARARAVVGERATVVSDAMAPGRARPVA